MTTETQQIAAEWAKLFQAMAEGKTIQFADCGHWYDLTEANFFDFRFSRNYRVAPEIKKGKYRVAALDTKDGYVPTTAVNDEKYAAELESSPYFVKWLTYWVEYSYEEKQ